MDLKVGTFNTAGLNSMERLYRAIDILKKSNLHILCAQELHLERSPSFPPTQPYHLYLSPDPDEPTRRAGVGFFVNSGVQDASFAEHIPGRVASLAFTFQGERIWLLNVYAPNSMSARSSFFDSLPTPPSGFLPILAGDWNCVPDSKTDKAGGAEDLDDPSLIHLSKYLSSLGLTDTFRGRHGQELGATCCSRRNFSGRIVTILSRLDRWYTPRLIENRTSVDRDHCFGSLSDHKLVRLTLHPERATPRGPGSWCLNTSLLGEEDYLEKIKNLIAHARSRKSNFISISLWWDWLKTRIRKLSINYSKEKAKARRIDFLTLQQKLENAESYLREHPGDPQAECDLAEAKKNHDSLISSQIEGARIRARAKWLHEGEKPTKYFFALEKERTMSFQMDSLFNTEGTEVFDQTDMLNVAKSYYSSLYFPQTDPQAPEAQNRILGNVDRTLSEDARTALDRDLSLEELTNALQTTGAGKSPGPDGLPAEFFKKFWHELGNELLSVFKEALDRQEMPISQRGGIITLLYKKGDRRDMKNWRPISLLNADFKLLSKLLANRLNAVLPTLVHHDQTAVKGRWIMDSIHSIQAAFDYLENGGSQGGVLFLDQQKAFDRVEHDYLFKVLERFGFGPFFINAIRAQYNTAEARVKVNNFLSEPIPIRRGVRQGDPLSFPLFVLVIETLAITIRNDRTIKGCKLPGYDDPLKLSLYADDTAFVFADERDLDKLMSHLRTYQQASGALLNLEKCEGTTSTGSPPETVNCRPMSWFSKDHTFRYLGVPVGFRPSIDPYWQKALQKVSTALGNWSRRNLSLEGRILITKAIALPKVQYLLFALPMSKQRVLAPLEKMIWSFIWNGKKSKIARSSLQLPRKQGGLEAVAVGDYCASMRMKMLQRLLDPAVLSPWKSYIEHKIQEQTLEWDFSLTDFLLSSLPLGKVTLPCFWTQVLKDWRYLVPKLPAPDTVKLSPLTIAAQPLHFNPKLQNKEQGSDPLSYRKRLICQRAGLKRIINLWKGSRWKNNREVLSDFGVHLSKNELFFIIQAIPKPWRLLVATVEKASPQQLRHPPTDLRSFYTMPVVKIRRILLPGSKTLKPKWEAT